VHGFRSSTIDYPALRKAVTPLGAIITTMTKREELRQQLSTIFKIYITAKENYNYCFYLHNPKTSIELEFIEKNSHLKFLRHSLWRITIIELAKLFSNKGNDKFKLNKLISKFWPDGHYSSMNIEPIKIIEWESKIMSKELAIEHVVNLRDKLYAHTDSNTNGLEKVDLFFYDIDTLFEIAGAIISDIYQIVFNSQVDLQTPIFDRNKFDLVNVLAEAHLSYMAERFGRTKGA
jgi:hypothetical protein